jgi:hypothetical protein
MFPNATASEGRIRHQFRNLLKIFVRCHNRKGISHRPAKRLSYRWIAKFSQKRRGRYAARILCH